MTDPISPNTSVPASTNGSTFSGSAYAWYDEAEDLSRGAYLSSSLLWSFKKGHSLGLGIFAGTSIDEFSPSLRVGPSYSLTSGKINFYITEAFGVRKIATKVDRNFDALLNTGIIYSYNDILWLNPDFYFYHGKENLAFAAGFYVGLNVFSFGKVTGSIFFGPYEFLTFIPSWSRTFGGIIGSGISF